MIASFSPKLAPAPTMQRGFFNVCFIPFVPLLLDVSAAIPSHWNCSFAHQAECPHHGDVIWPVSNLRVDINSGAVASPQTTGFASVFVISTVLVAVIFYQSTFLPTCGRLYVYPEESDAVGQRAGVYISHGPLPEASLPARNHFCLYPVESSILYPETSFCVVPFYRQTHRQHVDARSRRQRRRRHGSGE